MLCICYWTWDSRLQYCNNQSSIFLPNKMSNAPAKIGVWIGFDDGEHWPRCTRCMAFARHLAHIFGLSWKPYQCRRRPTTMQFTLLLLRWRWWWLWMTHIIVRFCKYNMKHFSFLMFCIAFIFLSMHSFHTLAFLAVLPFAWPHNDNDEHTTNIDFIDIYTYFSQKHCLQSLQSMPQIWRNENSYSNMTKCEVFFFSSLFRRCSCQPRWKQYSMRDEKRNKIVKKKHSSIAT